MYLIDRRNMAIHIYGIVKSLRKTALLLQVSHSSIQRWLKTIEQKKYCRTDTSQLKSTVIIDVIKSSIIHDPFISLMKLKDLIKNVLKIDTSKELIRVAIKRLGFTKKKARFYGEPKYLPEQTQQFIIARNKYIEEKAISFL